MPKPGRMVRTYDRLMASNRQRRYFGGSGFYNFGYWATGARTQKAACEALVDRLVSDLPPEADRVLDVACGLGASTARLALVYPPAGLQGVNLSERQLAEARRRAPGAAFQCMDATRLDFPDGYFDAVLCVEAAFHFDTRAAFLAEAYRVLKPGGRLALSDILPRPWVRPLARFSHVPAANFWRDGTDYRQRLEAGGWTDCVVEERTDACLGGFRRNLVRWPAAERAAGRLRPGQAAVAGAVCRLVSGYFAATIGAYLLVSARKPG